ncbi:MAG: rod shape-determining protein MreC [Treponema sp.]|jgi:rod shape-determining protein MreC|nr:rod shape-determining protein MreC [Treponema sp.]
MPIRGDYKRKKRFTAEAYVFIALSLVSFSALLVSTRSFIVDFRNLGLSLFSGARGGIHGITSFVSGAVLAVRELAVLRREYAELTERMSRYEQLERTAAEIQQENKRLREQLGFAETLRVAHIPARIIGRDPDNLFSALVINKGRREGLANDMPVVAFQNGMETLMGKVFQTGALESLVLPVYDVNFFVSARFSDSRYEGLVEGQGDREAPLLMKNIPKRAREEISYGDLVVSSGMGGVYPPGIAIGRVIRFQEYESSMTVELESVITFSRLEYVFVIGLESSDG